MRLHNRRTTILPSTTNLIGAYGPPLGVVSSCKVAPNITMMCLRRVARSRPACNSPLHYLPTPLGVCFGKDAIIRHRAAPRDDKLQSKKCDTGHMQAFSPCRDASGGVSFTLAGRLPFTRGSIPGVNDNMHASVYVCFGKAAIVRPRAPPPRRQTSLGRENNGVGSSAASAAARPPPPPPRRSGATRGGSTPKG